MSTPSEVIQIIGEEEYGIVFTRGVKEKYSDDEKYRLGKLVLKYKEEQDAAKPYSILKRQGHVARACREFYRDLKHVKHDDPLLGKATRMANRAAKRLLDDPAELEISTTKKKYRAAGGGRKVIFPEVRVQAYEGYINVR